MLIIKKWNKQILLKFIYAWQNKVGDSDLCPDNEDEEYSTTQVYSYSEDII